MNKYTSKLKKILQKDITSFVKKNRIPLISILVVVLASTMMVLARQIAKALSTIASKSMSTTVYTPL